MILWSTAAAVSGAARSSRLMKQAGYRKVKNLVGGICVGRMTWTDDAEVLRALAERHQRKAEGRRRRQKIYYFLFFICYFLFVIYAHCGPDMPLPK